MARKHGQCREHAGINCIPSILFHPTGRFRVGSPFPARHPGGPETVTEYWIHCQERIDILTFINLIFPDIKLYVVWGCVKLQVQDLTTLEAKTPDLQNSLPGILECKTGAGVSTTYQLEQPPCPKKNASWWPQAARKTAKRVPCAAGTGKRGILVVCCLCTNIWPRRLEFWIPIQPTWDPKGIYGDFLKWGISKSP